MNDFRDYSYIKHYGVKGMRWGVRRYQNTDGSLTSLGRQHYGYAGENKSDKVKVGTIASAENVKNGKKSFDKEKALKVLKTAAIVGGVAVGVAVVANIAKHYEIGYANNYELKPNRLFYTKNQYDTDFNNTLKNLLNTSKVSSINDLKKIPDNKRSTLKSVLLTNPGWPIPGRTNNCTFCSMNMVMREKGYDTVARMTPNGFDTSDLINRFFSNTKRINVDRKTLSSTLSKFKNGSYGEISVQWLAGGGHSLFWKIENGKAFIYDGQVKQKYSLDSLLGLNFLTSIKSDSIRFTDLTNAIPTNEILAAVMPR